MPAGCTPRAPSTATGKSTAARRPSCTPGASTGWVDISRTVGGAYNVPPGDLWMFEQSGTYLVAVNVNDNPQVIDINAGANFAAWPARRRAPPTSSRSAIFWCCPVWQTAPATTCASSAGRPSMTSPVGPSAPTCATCRNSQTAARCRALPAARSATWCRIAASARCSSCPATPRYLFISRACCTTAAVSAKYGFTTIGNVLYFVAEDGFYSLAGQHVMPIGQDKVNDWFLANSDAGRRNLVHCLAGVNKPRIVWVFHNTSASPMYDQQIIFDWGISRWAKSTISAYVWALMASPGLDLDTDGPEPGDTLLDSTAAALDSFAYIGGRPLIGAINPTAACYPDRAQPAGDDGNRRGASGIGHARFRQRRLPA